MVQASATGCISRSAAHTLVQNWVRLVSRGSQAQTLTLRPRALRVDTEATRAARRLCIGGSLIGSIKETQEMLDFCGKHNLTCDVEVRKKMRLRSCVVPPSPC